MNAGAPGPPLVLVTTADRDVRAGPVQIDRYGARGVREIPDRDRTRIPGRPGHRCHVVHASGAVAGVGQHQDRHTIVEMRIDLLVIDERELEAALTRESSAM